jgi:hypothetical protein
MTHSSVFSLQSSFFIPRSLFFALCSLLWSLPSFSQLLPLSNDIDKQIGAKIYSTKNDFHTSVKPYIQSQVDSTGAPSLQKDSLRRSWVTRKLFYEHLVDIKKTDYTFQFDFLPDFLIGRDNKNSKNIWLNTRGFQAQGTIGKGFSFHTDFYENQGVFPSYIDTFVSSNGNIMPGQGAIKLFGSNGYDYAYATGYIAYQPNKYFNFQLGNDRNFIGDGYRSVLLSDVAFPYPYFKITTDVGRVKYMVLYAQFQDLKQPQFSYDNGHRKKYGVFHYLDWSVTKRFSLGLFESIIWQDADSAGRRGFELSYLNPVIFLRPTEFSVGSPDNALVGLNIKYELFDHSALYGQFLLDEFKFDELKANKGWWANKFAIQAGFKSFDIFNVEHLNFLTEINTAKPYTYSQRTSLLNYGHYNEPLAHPLGANFTESVTRINYQYKRFDFSAQLNVARYGIDSANDQNNVGQDIFESYITRDTEYGNKIGQGRKVELMYGDLRVAYVLNPTYNLRIELGVVQRNEKIEGVSNNTTIITFGLRSSFRNIYYDR